MKIVIALLSLTAACHASLEPAGYRPPSSYNVTPPPSNYLPPSSTGNYNQFRQTQEIPSKQYLGPSVQSNSYGNGIDGSSPASRQYLSPNPSSSAVPAASYLPANQRSAISPVPLSRNYVPANLPSSVPSSSLAAPHSSSSQQQQQFGNSEAASRRPSNTYLQPAVQHSSPAFGKSFSGGFSAPLPLASARTPTSQYLAANQRDNSPGYHYGSLDEAAPAKYDFEYRVNDNYGNDYGHHESRDGDIAQGMYSVLLPDGRKQIVHYDADAEGFKPRITYEDTGFTRNAQDFANGGPY